MNPDSIPGAKPKRTLIQVTAQQRANAIEARDVMWPSVPEKNVFPELANWREPYLDRAKAPDCGTVACLGGWAEWWPTFRAQLGHVGIGGIPDYVKVAELFHPVTDRYMTIIVNSGRHPADKGFVGSAHALVFNRLNWLIENSEVVA